MGWMTKFNNHKQKKLINKIFLIPANERLGAIRIKFPLNEWVSGKIKISLLKSWKIKTIKNIKFQMGIRCCLKLSDNSLKFGGN